MKIASGQEEGSGYPELQVPGVRVSRKEAWGEWVEDGQTEKGILKS